MRKFKFLLIILPFLFLSLKPVGYLNDFAGILSDEQKEKIEKRLKDIEKETTNEICVLIIKSLEGKNIEEYANEIFNSWGIGKKGKDNGVLILISMNEKKIRIEVGYGLEGYLPDSVCGRIIREVMAPNFRKGDFYNGIYEAIEKIYKITKGEETERENVPPVRFRLLWYSFILFFSFIILGLIGLIFEAILISFFWINAFLNRNNPSQYELFILFSLLIPFFFIFILTFISNILFQNIRRRLKKYYGSRWREHIPFYLKGSSIYSSGSFHSGGGFSGGFGGFGGGLSGGGGATGRW